MYLRGCEALYLGDLVDVSKFCGAQDKVSKVETEPVLTNGSAICRNHVLHQEEEEVDKEDPTFKIQDNSDGGLTEGSLVLHLRSGDIFDPGYIKRSKAHGGFGQVCFMQGFVKDEDMWRILKKFELVVTYPESIAFFSL